MTRRIVLLRCDRSQAHLGPRRALYVLLLLLLPALAGGQEFDWDKADRDVVRLQPSNFPALPAAIRTRLAELGCTIPQTYEGHGQDNVIRGNFAAPRQVDWAVLCSRFLTSEILLFWGGSARCPAVPGKVPDRNSLQGLAGGKIGYSRGIAPVDRKYIMDHHEAYGGPKPPEIDHHGLDDRFLGKVSVTYYCYRGKWLVLQGAN